jgi:hypothetical protein
MKSVPFTLGYSAFNLFQFGYVASYCVQPNAATVIEEKSQGFNYILVFDLSAPVFISEDDSFIQCVIYFHPTNAEAKSG